MSAGPKPKREPPPSPAFVPHPDDVAELRASVEAVERGELLSEEESAAYLRSLLGDEASSA